MGVLLVFGVVCAADVPQIRRKNCIKKYTALIEREKLFRLTACQIDSIFSTNSWILKVRSRFGDSAFWQRGVAKNPKGGGGQNGVVFWRRSGLYH